MITVLTHDILPVFSMLTLGFLLGRLGKVSKEEASALNRVAFLVLQPALIFSLVNSLDWAAFRFDAIALYATCQIVLFTIAFVIARRIFGCETLEAWLLAMATIFVNTLLYIWPVSYLIYGETAALPVTAVVAWDSAISFAFFIVTTDLLANRNVSPAKSVKRVATNPVLIAIVLGSLGNALSVATPEPILTAFKFAGAGAAPLTLLALGVILSGQTLVPSAAVAVMSSLKLLAFPILVWAALHVGNRPGDWNALLVLCAAGPSGAMAFSLAMLNGVRTDKIAPVIIWTSTLSLLSLAWLA